MKLKIGAKISTELGGGRVIDIEKENGKLIGVTIEDKFGNERWVHESEILRVR